jgi:NADH-quinone oxidoreductase subunit N
MTPIAAPGVDWYAIAPVVALFGAALAILMLRSVVRHAAWVYDASISIAVIGIAVSGFFLWRQWDVVRDDGPYLALARMMAIDGFAVFLGVVVLIATFLTLLLSSRYLGRQGIGSKPEYVALLLISATGMLVMTTANDLIVVFIALETLSIPLYVLAAYDRNRNRSLESGMKYFVLGAFSSAVFLYGIALVYGGTGTTELTGIAGFLATHTLLENGTLIAGLMLLLVGLGFKVAAVPFHMWTPDVYEGAPSPITAFMASATKAAGFAALLRVLLTAFDSYRTDWRPAIWAIAILTLLVGSIAALVQTNVKRMLAYSSISHAGYVLIGLEAGTRQGLRAALFYLLVYTFMTIGSFAVVTVIARRDRGHSLGDYRALATRQPFLAALFAFFLLAQAGIPPTGGFMAKLGVFSAAANPTPGTDEWLSYSLLIVGVVASVISAFFYLRVVVTMYASEAEVPEGEEAARETVGDGGPRVRLDVPTGVVLVVCAAVTLWVGILPTLLLDFARDATLIF